MRCNACLSPLSTCRQKLHGPPEDAGKPQRQERAHGARFPAIDPSTALAHSLAAKLGRPRKSGATQGHNDKANDIMGKSLSRPKDKIKILLLEGISETAVNMLQGAPATRNDRPAHQGARRHGVAARR